MLQSLIIMGFRVFMNIKVLINQGFRAIKQICFAGTIIKLHQINFASCNVINQLNFEKAFCKGTKKRWVIATAITRLKATYMVVVNSYINLSNIQSSIHREWSLEISYQM